MATRRYLELDASGVLVERVEGLTTSTELAATTGAALVGSNITGFTNITGATLQANLASIDAALSSGGAVSSVNTLTGAVVLTGQNVTTNHTAANYTAAGTQITQHIAGIDAAIANISSALLYKGAFDASAGNYTALANASQGDFYRVSVGGTIGGVTYSAGDAIVINADVVGTPVVGQVDRFDNVDGVTSVNGEVGAVVLDGTEINTTAVIDVATPANASIDAALTVFNAEIKAAKKGDVITGFLAAQALAAGDPVFKSSATQVDKALATSDTALEVIGIASAAAASGAAVTVIPFGPAAAVGGGLTVAGPVFLASAGGLTQTAPVASGSYVLRIGKATSATDIDVEPRNFPIKLA
jgi:hypothetical protein